MTVTKYKALENWLRVIVKLLQHHDLFALAGIETLEIMANVQSMETYLIRNFGGNQASELYYAVFLELCPL